MEGLRAPREVYVGGERVEDVIKYAPFRKPIESYAKLYDRKHDPEHQDVLTYVGDDGERYDISFLVPKSKEDLKRKGRAFNNFSAASYGCLGRGPESMAALVAGLSESADWFEQWGEGTLRRSPISAITCATTTSSSRTPSVTRSPTVPRARLSRRIPTCICG